MDILLNAFQVFAYIVAVLGGIGAGIGVFAASIGITFKFLDWLEYEE